MTPLIALPAPRLPGIADEEAGWPPELPFLTRLLRRSRRLPDAPDWRAGILAALGADPHTPAVAVAAAALPALRGPLCFAAPVHLVAGISRVHLPPGARPGFAPGEEEAFLAGFNEEFGGADIALQGAAAGGGWVLAAPFASAARDAAPEDLAGDPLSRAASGDPPQRALRRFGAEVEMWLSGHALNAARVRRGQVPINALWLWGGAEVAPLAPLGSLSVLCASGGRSDAWLAGLARLAHAPLQQVADWTQFAAATGSSAGNALVVLAPEEISVPDAWWHALEQHWFGPLLDALDSGALAGLRLQVGASAWLLPHVVPAWLRWHGRRRWWQMTTPLRA